MGVLEAIDRHLTGLREALAAVSPDQLTGPDAARLVERAVDLERLGVSMRTRYAKRVADTGAFQVTGHKDATSWLAGVSGESAGAARGLLEVAEKLAEAPLVDQAFGDGRLSLAQAKVVAGAGSLDPSAQAQLLGTAERDSFKELREEALRVKRRALGEASQLAKEARAHQRRFFRIWATEAGGVRFEGLVPTADGARIRSVIDAEKAMVFREARKAGRRTADEAYLADALVRVVCGEGPPPTEVHLRVDLAALRRGSVEGDERCDIDGVGEIPVDVARDLLGDAWVQLVLRDGVDVKAVTTRKRTIPGRLRTAVNERDRGVCAVPGCPNTRYLEIDHDWEYSKGGPTSLDNLQLLCTHHHRLKTLHRFRLIRGPDGVQWVGPGSA